jgi:MraZ protein
MFIGEYQHALDEKGRLAVPVKFRADLKGGAVVTKGLDNCLFLYTKKSWQELAERIAKLPVSRANTRAFSRLMLAGAMDVDIDSQGRMLLPDYLRQYASIKKQVVVAGLYNRIELWDSTKWSTYKRGTEKSSGDIAEALGELGV